MNTKTALAILAAAALSGTAFAADMQTLDTNQDNQISQDEAQADPALVEKWAELDANQDGVLDQEEFAKFEAQ